MEENISNTAFQHWHQLFDDLCNRAGFYDDATLASAYCALTSSKGQRNFETAMRNLNNWRTGRHLPRTGNLRVLAKLLNVTADPATHDLWEHLYRQAGRAEAKPRSTSLAPLAPYGSDISTSFPITLAITHPPSRRMVLGTTGSLRRSRFSLLQVLFAGSALAMLGAIAGFHIAESGWRPWAGPADNAPIVQFRPVVQMKVGDVRAIHAERSDCGKLPREWEMVEADLPPLRTGTFSDGGLARRFSKFCQGLTPARAIVFTAMTPGVEEFEIQGDFFKMTVSE